jgi:hypothetical protein
MRKRKGRQEDRKEEEVVMISTGICGWYSD